MRALSRPCSGSDRTFAGRFGRSRSAGRRHLHLLRIADSHPGARADGRSRPVNDQYSPNERLFGPCWRPLGRRRQHFHRLQLIEMFGIFARLFRPAGATKQFPLRRNHFPLWRKRPETAVGYQTANEAADSVGRRNRRKSHANPQLHSRLRRVWLLDGRTVGSRSARHRDLRV